MGFNWTFITFTVFQPTMQAAGRKDYHTASEESFTMMDPFTKDALNMGQPNAATLSSLSTMAAITKEILKIIGQTDMES